jgi:hypothetical protein
MKKDELKEFLYYTQFRKKLSLIYFFLTKEGGFWIIAMYILYGMTGFLFFSIILLLSFAYMVREYFHYLTIEKYELPVFKKLEKFLRL